MVAAETMLRKRGASGMMAIIDVVALLGPPLFVPISALTVGFGAITVWIGSALSELWVILGLVGFAATFLNGVLRIKPRADRLSAMIAKHGADSPALIPLAEDLLMILRIDYVVLALVVADMVLKPALTDTGDLIAMAAVW